MKFMNIFGGKDKKEAISKGADLEGDFLESKRHTEYPEAPNLDEYGNPRKLDSATKQHFMRELNQIYGKYIIPCNKGMGVKEFYALEYATLEADRSVKFIKSCTLPVTGTEQVKIYRASNVKTKLVNADIDKDALYKVTEDSTTVTPVNAVAPTIMNGLYLFSINGVLDVCDMTVVDVELTDPVTDFEREYSGAELIDRGYRFAENIEV